MRRTQHEDTEGLATYSDSDLSRKPEIDFTDLIGQAGSKAL